MGTVFPLIVRLGGKPDEPSSALMPEGRAPFPFNILEDMMPMFPVIALMGWTMVLVSFLLGLFALSPAQMTFFSDAKAVREGAAAGSTLVQANVARHVLEAWVPQFKFVGLGLGLMAITMALGTIARRLRRMGQVISSHMPVEARPDMPPIPRRVRVFQLSTLMGIMILLLALIVGIVVATTVVPSFWNHSIANDLNPAEPGSALLARLGFVTTFPKWLNPLRMVGMAFLFSGITIALTVIIGTLRMQAGMLVRFYQRPIARGGLATSGVEDGPLTGL
jgi:hypothetical protein